jgi:hypothetical protein
VNFATEWLKKAQEARQRAEEARTIAELMRHDDAKQLMLKAASDYDALARQADQIGEQIDQLSRK